MSDLDRVGAIVRIEGKWHTAILNDSPDDPPADFALVTTGDLLRSGWHDSLGELLGFTTEDVELLRDFARNWHPNDLSPHSDDTLPAREKAIDMADRIEDTLAEEKS